MNLDEQELLRKLRQTFKGEAPIKIAVVRRRLYESNKFQSSERSAEMMRELHNLKGGSRIVALPIVNSFCEMMEKLLKQCDFPVDEKTYTLLMEGLDSLDELVSSNEQDSLALQDLRKKLELALASQEQFV